MSEFQDDFSREIWDQTYRYHEDADLDKTFWRVAEAIASAEATPELQELWTERFYDLLSDFKGTSGGRIYANAGTDFEGTTMLNCYVAPRDDYDIDSMESIIKDVMNQCLTLKSEGGWGQNFSWLRPRGSVIHGIGACSPGAVKYMEIYDKTSDVITSGSGVASTDKKVKKKIRKGAQMAVLDCSHPDVIEFITAKQNAGRLTKFNVSVNCSDEFMHRVCEIEDAERILASLEDVDDAEGDTSQNEVRCRVLRSQIEEWDKWDLIFPDTTSIHYKNQWDGDIKGWVKDGYPIVVHKTTSVKYLWNLIMESTYNRAEPGVLFLDRANHFDPLASYGVHKIQATNPCGEQTLPSAGCCNLGSMNLTQFVVEEAERRYFDIESFKKYAGYMVRFLDNVNTVSNAPLPEYKHSMEEKRRIGVGVLGWGSMLYMLRIAFGSDEAAELREDIMRTLAHTTYMTSIDLAEEKGAFSYCEPEKHAECNFVKHIGLPEHYIEKMRRVGIRNSSLMSIQPTGTTGIFANVVSGGMEPVFMPEYVRTVIVPHMPDEIAEVCPKWYEGEWYETEMFKLDKEGDEEILRGEHNGMVYKIDRNRGLTKEVLCQDYGVRWLTERGEWDSSASWAKTTMDLTTDAHVNDLQGFAKWVDSSLSKTINVPHEYPFEQFKGIYTKAFRTGFIKGLTTYRSGTMTSVLSAKEDKDTKPCEEEIILDDVKLPDSSPAEIKTIRAEGRKWYLTVVYYEGNKNRPFALFVKTNAPEKSITTNDAVDHLIELARSKGIPDRHMDDVLAKIGADNNTSKIARLISFNLRHGVLIKNIVSCIDRVQDVYVGTFLFQVKKFLASYIMDGEVVEDIKCLECGGQLVFESGCHHCSECGNSKCG